MIKFEIQLIVRWLTMVELKVDDKNWKTSIVIKTNLILIQTQP